MWVEEGKRGLFHEDERRWNLLLGSDWACRRLDKLLLPKRRLISRTHTKLHADLNAIRGSMVTCFLFPPFLSFSLLFSACLSSLIFVIERY